MKVAHSINFRLRVPRLPIVIPEQSYNNAMTFHVARFSFSSHHITCVSSCL